MPVILSGMSARGTDLPTILWSLGSFAFAGLAWSSLSENALPPIELAVGDLLAAAADDAVGDRQVLGLHAETLGGLRCERLPRGGRRVAQLHAAELDGEAAPGRALVGRERGIAGDDPRARERQIELFGDHLTERGVGSGAEIDLAGIDRAETFSVDGEEGIDLGERERFARRCRALRGCRVD